MTQNTKTHEKNVNNRRIGCQNGTNRGIRQHDN
jgi:hypothetical protein